ncbi:MAG: hypothetical protein M3Z21_01500 [Pseudomonadota bacterium]|nr:hypothetical protein [Pseudomonadota bacterium]
MILDKSEAVRRAINAYYGKYQQSFSAVEWLKSRLAAPPGSGRSDVSARRREMLADAFARRAADRQ